MAHARTSPCGKPEARQRARTARAYLEVADLVLVEVQRNEFMNVASGLAVLAGVAASDAICGVRLGQIFRGEDHRGAGEMLSQAVPDGPKLKTQLLRLLDVKDAAHYGVTLVAPRRARDSVKWAAAFVRRAEEEVER